MTGVLLLTHRDGHLAINAERFVLSASAECEAGPPCFISWDLMSLVLFCP